MFNLSIQLDDMSNQLCILIQELVQGAYLVRIVKVEI